MTVKRMRWFSALGLSLGLPCLALAQEMVWRPVAQTPARPVVVASTAVRPASANNNPSAGPLATLGRPLPLPSQPGDVPPPRQVVTFQQPRARTAPLAVPMRVAATVPHPVFRAAAPSAEVEGMYPPPPPSFSPTTAASVSVPGGPTMPASRLAPVSPATASPAVPASPSRAPAPALPTGRHTVSGPPDTVPPPSGGSPFAPPVDVQPATITDNAVKPGFWEKCKGWLHLGDTGSHTGRCSWQSDHGFPGLISPVTMPFLFEDPRSLTEVRPILMYQSIPSKTPNFGGGNAWFFGTQGRLAITERWSVVLHELGFVSLQPKDPTTPPVQDASGFAELKIGPKYTFLRNSETGSVAAAGLIFEVPVGNDRVFQNTGSLSLTPYLSYGQTFGRLPNGFGSVNFLANTGYSFSIDNKRSEFYYLNLHLDYNIANSNTFYPLIEMNWAHYTRAGTSTNLGTEGADLVNFGSSTRKGRDFFALAAGLRYRFTDNIWAGAAVQVPLSNERGLQDYRLTFDLIFRY